MATPPTSTATAAGDPDAAATGADTGADAEADTGGDAASDTVIVTIARGDDGGYIVYSGDEPGDDDEGQSADDAAAGGAAGPETQGQHVDSIGAALKAALDILNEDASSAGADGSSDDQFASGYSADQAPTPSASPRARLKYPAAA